MKRFVFFVTLLLLLMLGDFSGVMAQTCFNCQSVEQIFFEHNSHSLGGNSIQKLDSLCAVMKDNSDLTVALRGYASNTGSDDYNRKLIDKRLNAVKYYLVGKGIAATRVSPLVNAGIDKNPDHQRARRVDVIYSRAAVASDDESAAAAEDDRKSESEDEPEPEAVPAVEPQAESAQADTLSEVPAAMIPDTLATRPAEAYCPRLALRTNLLYDLAVVPNIGVEYFIDPHWSLAANVMYIWTESDPIHWYWRLFSTDLEGRYWLKGTSCGARTGHHLGAYAGFYRYDFEFGGEGWMGDYNYGGGLSYGYAIPLFPRSRQHFTLDMSLGLGYIGGTHKEYIPDDGCYVWQRTMRHNYFGPTKLEFSLVWYPTFGRGGNK